MVIPPQAVPTIWAEAEALLRPAIDGTDGDFLPEDVLALLMQGHMHLWLAIEGEKVLAAYVTEIVTYPRKRRARVAFVGGVPHSMKQWLEPMTEAIEKWAKQFDGIEAIGRKGWPKVVEAREMGVWLRRDYPSMEIH